ncbi:MAG: WXG100 family type VII secretion target [Oscillospiraceae bacterium]
MIDINFKEYYATAGKIQKNSEKVYEISQQLGNIASLTENAWQSEASKLFCSRIREFQADIKEVSVQLERISCEMDNYALELEEADKQIANNIISQITGKIGDILDDLSGGGGHKF